MWPTFADGTRANIPSTIPKPALRIGTIASFLPERTFVFATQIGVSTSTSSSGKSLVASYQIRFAISEIANVSIGEFVRKDKQNENGLYPVFNGGISNTGYYDDFNMTKNKIIMSARGANAGYVNKVLVDYWAGNSCYSIDVKDRNKVNWVYLFYLLKNEERNFMINQQTASIPSVSKKQVETYKIPIPPLEIQNAIVTVLDRFEKYANDLSCGLPAEIEKRKQQYEYYRDLWLKFEDISEVQTAI